MRSSRCARLLSLVVSGVGGLCAVLIGLTPEVSGAIIRTNVPCQPLTRERVGMLPKPQRSAWKDYLDRSEKQLRADHAFFEKELRGHGLKIVTLPPAGNSARSLALDKPVDWYAQPAAKRLADIVISFQTPAGGWSKNLDLTLHRRAPGEHFAPSNDSRFPGLSDYDTASNTNWHYVGTFDNSATITQLRFLAKVISAIEPRAAAPYRGSFLRGLDYIFAAQFPNGGWPQVWPLQGGYHDAITYNDNAIINILTLLHDVAGGAANEFAFVPAKRRRRASDSVERGLQCILATQIVSNGRRVAWGQQHDPLTLRPASARNYEMPAQAAAESAGIAAFLMQIAEPDRETVAALHAAVAWLEKNAIRDVAFRHVENQGRQLLPEPGGGPLWARFYEIGSDRPLFGDRDKSIHDRLDEISAERRNGYVWYSGAATRALEQYKSWSQKHPSRSESPITNP